MLLNNMIKTIVHGSNTIYLDVGKDRYFKQCRNLNIKEAENFTKDFLKREGRDIEFNIKNINENFETDNIEITVEILNDRKHFLFNLI
ncbi:MAG: hypothetical protein WCQ54_04135 [Clostridiaceae bacterium]